MNDTIQISIPANLRRFTSGLDEITVDGTTVGEALGSLENTFPELHDCLRTPDGKLRRTVLLFLDGENVHFLEGESTPIHASQSIVILPANAGG